MLTTLKELLRNVLFDIFVSDFRESGKTKTEIAAWLAAGKPVPPPNGVKYATLADYGAAFGLETLIETGTFRGGAIYALKNRFKKLYSIELSPELAATAQHRFYSHSHIQILQGDSGQLLPQFLSGIPNRAYSFSIIPGRTMSSSSTTLGFSMGRTIIRQSMDYARCAGRSDPTMTSRSSTP
jgi:hypothetical protein